MFANMGKGVTVANLFTLWGQWESNDFLIDFGVNFLPVGTPGASRAPLGDQVVSQTDFVTVSRCPGDAFRVLVAPLGELGPALERPWASRGRQKQRTKKKVKASGAQCVSDSTFDAKRELPGGVECG